MNKKKIADSIIIRVGGGIREVPRKPLDVIENQAPESRESGMERTEDALPIGADMAANSQIISDKVIN